MLDEEQKGKEGGKGKEEGRRREGRGRGREGIGRGRQGGGRGRQGGECENWEQGEGALVRNCDAISLVPMLSIQEHQMCLLLMLRSSKMSWNWF